MKNRNKKQKQKETIPETFADALTYLLRALVTVYTILILGVLPLYFEEGYTHIGTDKATFFKTASLVMARCIVPALVLTGIFILVVKVGKRQKGEAVSFLPRLNVVDWFAVAYAAAVVVSYLCTDYKETALWGTKGWYMGMLPHLILVAIYFLVSRFMLGARWVLYLCMAVSAGTFALGCLNRFNIWPIPMEYSGLPAYISTIGNINWFCGYIVSVFFVGVGLLWLEQGLAKWGKILLSVYVWLGFAALVIQGSDSGLFTLAIVLMAMFILSAKAKTNHKMSRFWWIILLFAAACLGILVVRLLFPGRLNEITGMMNLLTYSPVPGFIAIVAIAGLWYSGKSSAPKVWTVCAKSLYIIVPLLFAVIVALIVINTKNPGSLGALSQKSVFTFNDQWGSYRGGTWRMGWEIFGEQDIIHKLVGVGSDCMADYLYSGSSDGLRADVQAIFVNQRLTNAHNEWLTLLVNEGICGVIAFAGMMLCLLKKLLGAVEDNPPAASCGLCLLAYVVNNIWSFQQSLSVSTIFVIMGIGAYLMRYKKK